MRKSIISAAVALLAIGATAGAQAQNVIANGDFELANVATGGFESFANLGWNNLQWGSYSGTSSIVDVAGDQAARVNGGDVIWSAFQVTTAGDYELSFDAVGDGYYSLYNASTNVELDRVFVQQVTETTLQSAAYSLNTGDVYRLYFGSTVLPPTFSNSLTVDNVTVAAVVPEPETYAMMLAGLGALGLMNRRRMNGKRA
ncbi:MAG: PEP-CTERM sorting domain-containing protein [Sphaerotilus natans subsp. sulfidivorans]|uniref:PEP-CTERM sorting domain-containing protein n=1 Tax=Sphaerotilus sulfidivorans TaxID=639200 RepID=UPI00235746EA|nr:PEP-CTERM sorting domain-containing protein [Sphaerotilus sulfidivorans]MCK6400593.1 PEP-CTERM sorting domain-containing protein [Sphaerotilus sulfidivorans]